MSLNAVLDQIEQLNDAGAIASFKQANQAILSWLQADFSALPITDLILGRAKAVDALVSRAWQLCGLGAFAQLSLVAVGGYGRGQLQPYSDVDLLILAKKDVGKPLQQAIGQFITLLWDTGLDIGQSVRTLKECRSLARQDITIATNLLESRVLAGCTATYSALMQDVHSDKLWRSEAFFVAKAQEQQTRHNKFNGTAYNLEPNIKENPGCLRDIQTIGWVAKKHFHVQTGRELVAKDYFSQEELDELRECREHLWRVRFALHLQAGRSENRLLFDYQPDVAAMLGYGEGKQAVEKMMRTTFRITSRVIELNEMLLQRFRHDVLNKKIQHCTLLNDDFSVCDGLIMARHANVFAQPEQLLQFFILIARTPDISGIHHYTLRLLRLARRRWRGQYLHQFENCRQLFMAFLAKPNAFGLAWDLMHRHGIMQAYLPQWDQIVGMMQFDLFHAYTVDEHTHRLVKQIYGFAGKDGAKDFPRCQRIVSNLDHPEYLFIAALFHDIAKGRGGDHSELGALDVREFCATHHLSDEAAELIEWLVANHLTMSVTAQRRDIYDPDVVAEFCAQVQSQEYLDHLYVLTLADIRATNDNLWNDWKASLLRELYLMTSKALESDQTLSQDFQQRIRKHQSEARASLHAQGWQDAEIDSLWHNLDSNYFVRFKAIQIAWQTNAILTAIKSERDVTLVAISEETCRGGTEVLIYTKDRPSLFAQVVSVIDSCRCSVQDASISSTQDGYVLDSFTILNEQNERIDQPASLARIQKAIHRQLVSGSDIWRNNRKLSRQMKQLSVPTKVRFFTNQAGQTLLELEALDAPGLLATISKVFVELNLTLHMAKITTIGERAEDVFILSNADDQGLTQSQQLALKKQLSAALDNLS